MLQKLVSDGKNKCYVLSRVLFETEKRLTGFERVGEKPQEVGVGIEVSKEKTVFTS
jgi:hypothetical protein